MQSYQFESFGKPLAQVLRETPQPQGTEVLVQVSRCGVCHSDVHLHDGYFDLGEAGRSDLTRSVAPPRTLGHEIAGTVAALGPEVDATTAGVRVGDARVVYPWIGCGSCGFCSRGEEHLCNAPRALGVNRDGGFASHVLVPHPRYLVAHDGVAPEQACVHACSGITAFGALKKVAPLAADGPLLVIGAGGVGLSGIRLAKHLFGRGPVVAEIDAAKWDLARAAGAAEVIDPRADGALRALVKATGGGVAAAVDFVGAGPSFAFGLGALRKGGTLVAVGLLGGSTPIVPAVLALKGIAVVGSYVGSLADLHELMAIARRGALPDMPVTLRPLAEAGAALDALREGHVRGRTILVP